MTHKVQLGHKKSGVIRDIFSNQELVDVVNLMSRLHSNDSEEKSNRFKPIGIGHVLYSWFEKKMLNKILNNFEDEEHIKMTFASYTNEKEPFKIHSDYYHKRSDEPCIAILLPLSVDHGEGDIGKSATIVFDQTDTYFDKDLDPTAKKYLHKWKDTHTTVKENNASSIHTDYLSHCDKDELEYLTVQNIVKWKRGDAIWWDEKYLHSSNNFKANNIDNKQFIIIHTHKI